VKTLYTLSQQSAPADDQIPQLVEFDEESHLLKIQINEAADASSSKILKFQVFQQIKVLIRVDEGNDRQSIRKLVMTIMTDEALARDGLPQDYKVTKTVSQSNDIEEVEVETSSRKKRKPIEVTEDEVEVIVESQKQTPKKKKLKIAAPKK
jgi:hypothetical protein